MRIRASETEKEGETMPAYFVFEQEDPKGTVHEFVFAVNNELTIAEARRIIATPDSRNYRVKGTIVPEQVWYNPKWSFHLNPETIGFFEYHAEVCDANVTYVEEHLAELWGSALPNFFWCPWSSRLIRETSPPRRDQEEAILRSRRTTGTPDR
jgi:hypothetical protein